jgi:hypothetical protein
MVRQARKGIYIQGRMLKLTKASKVEKNFSIHSFSWDSDFRRYPQLKIFTKSRDSAFICVQ